jgi:hypothetical protein
MTGGEVPMLLLALGPIGEFLYHEAFGLWLFGVLLALLFVAREMFRPQS